jgi:hypothetical protein
MAANVSFLTPDASLTTPFWYGPGHVEMSFDTKINLVHRFKHYQTAYNDPYPVQDSAGVDIPAVTA